ncbi:sensor histidine kinase VxrA [uncultured Aliivibrio sp.]|uniref:sensor histidine kinase VxrA n=1 Tax=uncultured Aliivibrio sp. TaxID=873085 RepID=UPI002633B5B5|nr:sensor histidine kinase VxrA [uncultured Aliivibrio sp.]
MINKRFLVSLLLLIGFSSQAESLATKIDSFKKAFKKQQAVEIYDIRLIQKEYPTVLLSPDTLLPQTASYPFKQLQQLYKNAQNCTGPWPVSPLVGEPLVLIRAICKGISLPTSWFARSGMIHPGGGSYAYRYVEKFPKKLTSLAPYMHIKERPLAQKGTLLRHLQKMDDNAIKAIISGSDTIIADQLLWIRKGSRYYLYPIALKLQNLDKFDLDMSEFNQGDNCYVRNGNVCWQDESNSQMLSYIVLFLILANLCLAIGWGISQWNSKRREMKSQMLVLQILTHELRTPIASLGLTVEGFRRQFESLPESLYDEFRRLCEDSRRLRQLAEASKDYLQSDDKGFSTDWIPSVEEWLSYRCMEYSQPVAFKINKDSAIKVNIYWLGNCIDNLISNAHKYGIQPVTLNVTVENKNIKIEVIDGGQLTKANWKELKTPFVSKAGLGLGLTIVESMIKRMGGTMILQGPPTTFILEIPCETDNPTR